MLTTAMLLILVVLSTCVGPDLLRPLKGLNASVPTMASISGEKNSLENTIGIITLNKKNYTRTRRLQFFNNDDSLWYEFSFYEDDTNHSFEPAKGDFQPFSFHRDYFVLALKCVGEDGKRFQVVVNETTRLSKFIRKNDENFRFQTWQEHILDVFAVGFDPSNNPLRARPRESVRTIRLPPNEVTFHPLQISGDWLKVRWNVSDDREDKSKKIGYGWVRWRQNRQLLLEFFYFS